MQPRNPLVSKLELFARLSNSDVETFERASSLRVRAIDAHEDLIRQGEEPRHVNLIIVRLGMPLQAAAGRKTADPRVLPARRPLRPENLHFEENGSFDRGHNAGTRSEIFRDAMVER